MKASREQKKLAYSEYLQSSTWYGIRAGVLARDQYRCRSAKCASDATVVHHARYPKVLGEERLEWLYALCVPCHEEIHRLARAMPLREATRLVLGLKPKKKRRRGRRVRPVAWTRSMPKGPKQNRRSRSKLCNENEILHQRQVEARERRERRRGWAGVSAG